MYPYKNQSVPFEDARADVSYFAFARVCLFQIIYCLCQSFMQFGGIYDENDALRFRSMHQYYSPLSISNVFPMIQLSWLNPAFKKHSSSTADPKANNRRSMPLSLYQSSYLRNKGLRTRLTESLTGDVFSTSINLDDQNEQCTRNRSSQRTFPTREDPLVVWHYR